MYDRIVVALDGSKLAEKVLPHVEALGKPFHSTLVLVRASMAPDVLAPSAVALGGPVVDPLPIIEAEVREAVAYLEAVATRLRKQGPRSPAGHSLSTPMDPAASQPRVPLPSRRRAGRSWTLCWPTTGRATCASSRTSWSAS